MTGGDGTFLMNVTPIVCTSGIPRPSSVVTLMLSLPGLPPKSVSVARSAFTSPSVPEIVSCRVPDPVMGEKVGAVLVPAPGGGIDVPAVLAYLAERIADFKVPQYVVVQPQPLPRNPGGKLLKRRLRDSVDWSTAAVPRV